VTDDFTVLIAARNAAGTIGRAITSIRNDARHIILIDDGSTDRTVAIARALAGSSLEVVSRQTHEPLGATRQAGLDRLTTTFAAWLDADDEYVAGRVQRLMTRFAVGDVDVIGDTTQLVDGPSGSLLAEIKVPDWEPRPNLPARLFERNPLPAIGLLAFRAASWRTLGYDGTLHGAEDVDIVLRAVAARARFGWVSAAGTRVHIYPDSLSRDRENQRAMYARVLRKHSYEAVSQLYAEAGIDAAATIWGLISMALFRDEPETALRLLDEADRLASAQTWRVAFVRGTALLMAHDAEAIRWLERAESLEHTPEGLNNLGVALAQAGKPDDARRAFEKCLVKFPHYQDARWNLEADMPTRITTHPLRRS
jgi:glycosyltransferase involved in cell wall biosynthesis